MIPRVLSAPQEERLRDIADGRIHLRGTRASHRVLERLGLVASDKYGYGLTHDGFSVLRLIRERASK